MSLRQLNVLLLDEYATFAMNVRMEEAERRRGKGEPEGRERRGEERKGKELNGTYVCVYSE